MTRNKENFVLSRWDTEFALGALTVGSANMVALTVFDEDIYLIDGDFAVVFSDLPDDTEPPILYGTCPANVSSTELQNALNADAPANRADDNEYTLRRGIVIMGVMDFNNVPNVGNKAAFHRRHRLNTTVYNEGSATLGTSGLMFWCFNIGADTLSAGVDCRINAQIHGRWM